MRISDWSSDVCSSDLRRPDRGKIKRKYRILAIIAIAVARPHRLRDTAVILAHVNISIHVRVIVVHININDRDGRRPCSTTATVAGSPGTRSEEHTSELQSLMRNSYAVFCSKKKTTTPTTTKQNGIDNTNKPYHKPH